MADKRFLYKLESIVRFQEKLASAAGEISLDVLGRGKQLGFSDLHIARLTADSDIAVRTRRVGAAVGPAIKQIDTVAAKFPAKTNYIMPSNYANVTPVSMSTTTSTSKTYRGVIVLGSGAYRVGGSVEFDWCTVSATRALNRHG